ncbi:hypothetical protein M758_8G164000 [Ceratodon purpureus]|nr:hypothetical protein M758_8G164000 [Ceratodon purpureus]
MPSQHSMKITPATLLPPKPQPNLTHHSYHISDTIQTSPLHPDLTHNTKDRLGRAIPTPDTEVPKGDIDTPRFKHGTSMRQHETSDSESDQDLGGVSRRGEKPKRGAREVKSVTRAYRKGDGAGAGLWRGAELARTEAELAANTPRWQFRGCQGSRGG